ncbi:MAG: PQQ-like beta-propeller repeat protein [Pirellulales bacterium]|nr:PQQ-like beta-propeller repeat protein [Pirellulales bacterium]
MSRFLALAFVFAILPPDFSKAADEWPQWRGPNRDGHSPDKGLLKEWPEGGPKLVWKATGLGIGYTNVTVSGGRIFLMGDKDGSSYAIVLNLDDGKPIWAEKVGKAGAPGWGAFAGPRCTPTIDGDLVFAVGQYGEVACLEAATGKEVWRKDYIKDFDAKLPEWGYCGMPLVDGKQVILAPGGKNGDLVALDKKTGELIWRSKDFIDGIHYSSPIVAEIGGVRQYIQLTDASVAGISAADGSMLWRAPRKGAVAVIPTPIYRDGFVYVCSGYNTGSNLFKIEETDGKFTAEEVYAEKATMQNQHGGVVLVGKHLFGHSDRKGWTCQDFETGKALWTEKEKLGKGSITYADGLLYLREESAKGGKKSVVALVEPSAEGYKEISRFEQPDRSKESSWPHPVVIGGRLYLRDQDVLLCYDVKE